MPSTVKPLPYRPYDPPVPWRWVVKGTDPRWAERLARETTRCSELPSRNPAEVPELDWTLIDNVLVVMVFDAAGVQVVSNEDLTNHELLLHAENALAASEDEHTHLRAMKFDGDDAVYATTDRDESR